MCKKKNRGLFPLTGKNLKDLCFLKMEILVETFKFNALSNCKSCEAVTDGAEQRQPEQSY